MPWIPSTEQLELIVSHSAARVPAATSARLLGVEVEDLRQFAERLAIGRAYVQPDSPAAADVATPKSMLGTTSPFR
jgi:hypothetical protein